MLRREMGNEYVIVRQDDHAVLSGQLAEHFGNGQFARPAPYESVVVANRMHDSGWPLHDDLPTINEKNQPLHVFESPLPVALKVWTTSADRAAAVDAYAGLLVSLHVLALSSQPALSMQKMDVAQLNRRFELNKFQHREVERQESLRQKLGFKIDVPLTMGLPDAHASDRDDQLRFNFRLLQAMDLLSLCLCCTSIPAAKTNEVHAVPGDKPIHLAIERPSPFSLVVDPWPFDVEVIRLQIPIRRIPSRAHKDDADLREALSWAAVDQQPITVSHAM